LGSGWLSRESLKCEQINNQGHQIVEKAHLAYVEDFMLEFK
jgi:hypothetical protein